MWLVCHSESSVCVGVCARTWVCVCRVEGSDFHDIRQWRRARSVKKLVKQYRQILWRLNVSCEGEVKASTDFICPSQEGEAASPDGGLASCVRFHQMNTHAHVFPGRSSQVATPVTVDEQQRNFGSGCDIAQYRVCWFCCRRKCTSGLERGL